MNIFHGQIGMLHDIALLIQYLVGKGDNALIADWFAHNLGIPGLRFVRVKNHAFLAQRNPTSLNAWLGGKLNRYATLKYCADVYRPAVLQLPPRATRCFLP